MLHNRPGSHGSESRKPLEFRRPGSVEVQSLVPGEPLESAIDRPRRAVGSRRASRQIPGSEAEVPPQALDRYRAEAWHPGELVGGEKGAGAPCLDDGGRLARSDAGKPLELFLRRQVRIQALAVMGYELALAHFTEGAQNRVVLFSDGVANIGQTDQDRIAGEVKGYRDRAASTSTRSAWA